MDFIFLVLKLYAEEEYNLLIPVTLEISPILIFQLKKESIK
jgi:hypothetical protein